MPTTVKVRRSDTLTPAQAARMLGVSRPMVYYLIRVGRLDRYSEPGSNRIVLLKREVEALEQTVELERANPERANPEKASSERKRKNPNPKSPGVTEAVNGVQAE